MFRFSETSVTVAEPVTNFDIDNEPLTATIMREGDNTMETTVGVRIYSPTTNTAHLGQHFKLLSDVVVFRPGEVQASIPVRILATPTIWSKVLLFELELWPTEGNRWATRESTINPEYSKLRVHIKDRRFRGPFFPALPVISSTKHESYEDDNHQEGALSALFPLTCITVSAVHNKQVAMSLPGLWAVHNLRWKEGSVTFMSASWCKCVSEVRIGSYCSQPVSMAGH